MKHTPAIRTWLIAGAIGLAAGLAQPASTATAATVSFFNDGVDNIALSTGLRFDTGCFSDAAMTVAASCSGALIDVSLNNFDTNAANGLVGDMTDSSNVNDPTLPGSGVTPAEELQFVQNYIGDALLDWTGVAGTTDAGGAGTFTIAGTVAKYILFKVGLNPNYALLRNDSGGALWIDFAQIGQGAGLSHFAEFGVVPLPATLPLFLAGLLGLGFLARRRRQALEA